MATIWWNGHFCECAKNQSKNLCRRTHTGIRSFEFNRLSTNRKINFTLAAACTVRACFCFMSTQNSSIRVIWFMAMIFQKFIGNNAIWKIQKIKSQQRLLIPSMLQITMAVERTNERTSSPFTRLLFTMQFYTHRHFAWPRPIFFPSVPFFFALLHAQFSFSLL